MVLPARREDENRRREAAHGTDAEVLPGGHEVRSRSIPHRYGKGWPMTDEQKIQALTEILEDLKMFKGQGIKAIPEVVEMILGLVAMYEAG
jgi:hypothetical protein